MKDIRKVLSYLREENLILTSAESCTAGQIIHLLAKIPGSGACLDTGFVVYSVQSKKKLLKVHQSTIKKYSLTSEEVVLEMVQGALKLSRADIVVATTGVAGPGSEDGIPEGTICFGWGFKATPKPLLFSETKKFNGTRSQILTRAATYALTQIPMLHQDMRNTHAL